MTNNSNHDRRHRRPHLLPMLLLLFSASVDALSSPHPPSSSQTATAANRESVHLRVVHFNDIYKLDHLPKLKGYLQHLHREPDAPKTICTLGGDFFSPSLLSSIDQGEAMVACLSELGVDYACLGNHEADHGPEAFAKNIDNFDATVLNSNFPTMPLTKRKMPEFATVKVSNPGGSHCRRVSLLGLLETSPNLYLPNAFCEGALEDAIPIRECLAQHLERIKHREDPSNTQQPPIDMILPLTHQDVDLDVKLAQEFGSPEQMPLILGGHDHEIYDVSIPSNDVSIPSNDDDDAKTTTHKCRVLKAGMDAENAIVVDLQWPTKDAVSPEVKVEFVNVANLPESYSDSRLADLVEQYHAPLRRLDRTVLKVIENRKGWGLNSMNIRKQQTTVGSLICTALRKALRADVAIMNAGAIRGNSVYTYGDDDDDDEAANNDDGTSPCGISHVNDLQQSATAAPSDSEDGRPKEKRFFTFADLHSEIPYSTEVCVVKLPGSVLEAAIDFSRRKHHDEGEPGGGFLQCCNKMDAIQVAGGKWKILQIRGEPFNPNKLYNVATVQTLLKGMDDIQPLVDFANQQGKDQLPHEDATQPAKDLVLQVYRREIWQSLGSFEDIDTDGSGDISLEELGTALSDKFGIDPEDQFVSDTLRAFDVHQNGVVSKEEYDACMLAVERNRFDLSAADCKGLAQVSRVIKFLDESMKDPEHHSWLSKVLQKCRCQKGEVILRQGDNCDSLYFCESGQVKFIADGEDAGSCGEGGSFGELALLYDTPRAATCIASSDCTLWKVDREAFRLLLALSNRGEENQPCLAEDGRQAQEMATMQTENRTAVEALA